MFSDPNAIISQLHLLPGQSVADLGAGTGAYSFLMANIVGQSGKVYACDVQKDMLTRIENEAKERHVSNIQTVWSNIENHQGTKLRDQSVDWVVIANTLFQVEDRAGMIKEISRILKPAGSALLVDWAESYGNLGPRADQVISKDSAIQLFGTQGLRPGPQEIEAGSHHYGIIFKKQV